MTAIPSLTLVRRFHAPLARVFAAWTRPELLARWFGPHHTRATHVELDPREGGDFRIVLEEDNGTRHEIGGTYTTVEPERLLVFTWAWAGAAPERRSRVTVAFRALADETEVTVTHDRFADAETATRHRRGWTESLERLLAMMARPEPAPRGAPDGAARHGAKFAMQMQPYLFFEGRCAEAIAFYGAALGAEVVELMRGRDSPDPTMAGTNPDNIIHASLRIGETRFRVSDGRCDGTPAHFAGFSLCLSLPDEPEATRVFASLGDGGQVQMPLMATFFSPAFGMLADRFGVSWMIVVEAASAR